MNKKMLVISGLICLSIFTCLTIQPRNEQEKSNIIQGMIKTSILPPTLGYCINITDESELSAFVNKTGSGTEFDPYIIEDMSIYADVANGHCAAIQIMNTNSYIELNQLYLNGSNKTSSLSANIMLVNCSNVKIFQCISENQTDAIQNFLILNCTKITIENCTIDAMVYNILQECRNIKIYNSTNLIINDTIIKNGYQAISFDLLDIFNAKMENITIIDNTIINHYLDAIVSSYNIRNVMIHDNFIQDVGRGVLLEQGNNISIQGNYMNRINIFNALKFSNVNNLYINENYINDVHDDRLNRVNAIEIIGNDKNVTIYNNEISNSLAGILIAIYSENVNVSRNNIHDNRNAINLKNYIYDISITENFLYYSEIAIFSEGFPDNINITRNYFKRNFLCFYNNTDIIYQFYLSHNFYFEYLELYPYAVFANESTNVLQYTYYLTSDIVDLYPEYYHAWYSNDKFLYIAYFSNYDLQGFFFETLICYIDNERLATSTAIINDNIIHVRVSDYANITLKQFMYNYNTSKYLDIGLDVSEIAFYNRGNETSIVHIERNNKETFFVVAPNSFRLLRFADGSYKFWVTDSSGETQITKKTVDIDNEHTSFDVTWSIPISIPVKLTLNVLDYLIGIGMVAIIGIVVYLGIRRNKGPGYRRTGNIM